jgi:hypothetical protein
MPTSYLPGAALFERAGITAGVPTGGNLQQRVSAPANDRFRRYLATRTRPGERSKSPHTGFDLHVVDWATL